VDAHLLSGDRLVPDSEDQYRFLAEALPQIVWLATPEYRIVYVNSRWREYTGLTLEQTQGGGWSDTIHPDDLQGVTDTVEAGRLGDGTFTAEYRLRRASDGVWRWHLGRSRIVRMPDGSERWLGTALDIDDHKRVEEDRAAALGRELELRRQAEKALGEQREIEQKLLLLVEASSALIASTDSAQILRTILDVARRFVEADAYGVWRKQKNSPHWDMVAADGLSDQYSRTVTELNGNIPPLPHFAVPIEDVGHAPLVAHRAAAYSAEGIRSMLTVPLVIRGVSEGTITFYYRTPHHFTEMETRVAGGLANLAAAALGTAELYERSESLYRDASKAREALERSNAELKRANDDLNHFAWSASHDLQEPLRMVAIYNQMLASEYADRLDGNAREYIRFSVHGARQMEMLVRDILAYTNAAATAGEPLEPVQANDAIQKVRASLEATIRESSAEIEAADLPELMVQEVHFIEVLQHLIANAIKYKSAEKPRIRIGAEPLNGYWKITVSDNGIGIAPDYSVQIFGIFKRLHTAAEYPGTGVGLAICQKIVERYGGRMWVESEEGKGSTFIFTLPGAETRVY
jgi:PAS domain S-box-containing protein